MPRVYQVNASLLVQVHDERVAITKRVMESCHMSITITQAEVAPLIAALAQAAGLDERTVTEWLRRVAETEAAGG